MVKAEFDEGLEIDFEEEESVERKIVTMKMILVLHPICLSLRLILVKNRCL